MDKIIKCPYCGNEISKPEFDKIQDRIKAELEQKVKDERETSLKEIEDMKLELKKKAERIDEEIEQRTLQKIKQREQQIVEQAIKEAKVELKEKEDKIKQMEQKELEWLRKERALTERERTLELTVEKRLSEESKQIWEKASRTTAESLNLQLQEKDHTIDALKKSLDDLQRKVQSGSAQIRGEIQETILEELLRDIFPQDKIDPISPGKPGGDVLETVCDKAGRACGIILWESKQTKAWSNDWLKKARDDQRRVSADMVVIVTHALPKEIQNFASIEGVLVIKEEFISGIAEILRRSLINISHQKLTEEQKDQKMSALYGYMTSKEFIQKIVGIVDAHKQIQEILDRERSAHEKIWSQRSKLQLQIVQQAAQLYGDVSGLLMGALPHVDGLELITHETEGVKMIESKEDEVKSSETAWLEESE